MRKLTFFFATTAVALVLAAPVAANGPDGAAEKRLVEYVDHVCRNRHAVQCLDTNAEGTAFTACECTRNPDTCRADPPAPSRFKCVIDFIHGARLKGTLKIIGDDFTQDNFDEGTGMDDNHAWTFLLELRGPWGRPITIAETFYGDEFDAIGIGPWNPVFFEDEVFGPIEFENQIPVKSMLVLQEKLRRILRERFRRDGVPLLTDLKRIKPRHEADESDADNDLASVAIYSIVIKYANGTSPTE